MPPEATPAPAPSPGLSSLVSPEPAATPGSAAAVPAGSQPPPTGQTPPTPPSRPDYIPEEHWDAETGAPKDTFVKHVAELETAHKELTEKAAAIPKDPAGYKVELPPEVITELAAKYKEVPAVDIKLDPEHPLIGAAQKILHKHKASPEILTEMAREFLDFQVAAKAFDQRFLLDEFAKLGPQATASARYRALTASATAQIGAADAEVLTNEIRSAAGFNVIEKLLLQKANQGVSQPNGHAHETPTPPPAKWEDRLYPDRKV